MKTLGEECFGVTGNIFVEQKLHVQPLLVEGDEFPLFELL